MGDKAASIAARQLSVQRWQAQRPIRLARELTLRAHELPAAERARLLEALTKDVAHD